MGPAVSGPRRSSVCGFAFSVNRKRKHPGQGEDEAGQEAEWSRLVFGAAVKLINVLWVAQLRLHA